MTFCSLTPRQAAGGLRSRADSAGQCEDRLDGLFVWLHEDEADTVGQAQRRIRAHNFLEFDAIDAMVSAPWKAGSGWK